MHTTFKISTLALAAMLAACGGGGGSPGVTEESYGITLRAEKTQLPLNVAGSSVRQGVYAPYSTTLYVEASAGGRPIPGGKDIFTCNVSGGLDSGSLYYLDGNPEHEKEVDDGNGGKIKVPGAYRSITLDANSGGNSFHFHAQEKAGIARITCTVTDPRDKQQKSASVEITVGGATGKAASVQVESVIPGYLGTKENTSSLKNQMALVAFVLDDANQPVAASNTPNLQVSIRSNTEAASGARLLAEGQSGSVLQLKTGSNGTAQFSLLSGKETGPIFLEFSADRRDNNVQNGIEDQVSAIKQVYVIDSFTESLGVQEVDLGAIANGVPFFYLLKANGGLPPYEWVVTGLPAGLMADNAGVISGTPKASPGKYLVKVRVTDKNKISVSKDLVFNLTGDKDALSPSDFFINGCANNNINQPCSLPNATPNDMYTYAFTASVTGVTWEFAGLPAWLTSGTAGTNGYVSGKPKPPNLVPVPPDLGSCGKYSFLVTAKKEAVSVTRQVAITVAGGGCP